MSQKKLISIESLMGCSVGAWEIRILKAVQMIEAWFVKFQNEAKTLPELLCKEFVVFGQLELKNQLWLTRNQKH